MAVVVQKIIVMYTQKLGVVFYFVISYHHDSKICYKYQSVLTESTHLCSQLVGTRASIIIVVVFTQYGPLDVQI